MLKSEFWVRYRHKKLPTATRRGKGRRQITLCIWFFLTVSINGMKGREECSEEINSVNNHVLTSQRGSFPPHRAACTFRRPFIDIYKSNARFYQNIHNPQTVFLPAIHSSRTLRLAITWNVYWILCRQNRYAYIMLQHFLSICDCVTLMKLSRDWCYQR